MLNVQLEPSSKTNVRVATGKTWRRHRPKNDITKIFSIYIFTILCTYFVTISSIHYVCHRKWMCAKWIYGQHLIFSQKNDVQMEHMLALFIFLHFFRCFHCFVARYPISKQKHLEPKIVRLSIVSQSSTLSIQWIYSKKMHHFNAKQYKLYAESRKWENHSPATRLKHHKMFNNRFWIVFGV